MSAYSNRNYGDLRMRTHAKDNASPAVSEGETSKPSVKTDGNGSWFRLHWRLLSLLAIIIVAFLFRFVFAYGISAGDNYALSGGTSASSHLRIITEILAGTYNPANEMSMNYPFGTASISGPLFDYFMAAIAWLVTCFGIDTPVAAAGTLAWSAPIFGALTCVPVYLIAKRLFKDEVISLVSALFYAVFAASIMTTAFSNGAEYPMLCFIVAWFVYFVASAYSKADELNATGIGSVFKVSAVRKFTFAAAISFAFIVLTWTGFWAAVMTMAIMVLLASVIQRVGGKDLGVLIGIPLVSLLVGIVVGAVYYIPTGLWNQIFEGGCILAVLVVVYSLIFLALEKKPWVLSIPLTAAIIFAVAVILAVAVPSVSSAVMSGSLPVTGALAHSLAEQFSRTSISTMASYYGWLTVWLPLFAGVWMAYKFRDHSRSLLYMFTMIWLLASFFVGWFSTEYALVAGAGFAVGSGYVLVSLIRKVDMRSYLKSLRGNGFKAGARKALNFFPLVTLLVTVFLVAVPTAVYAVDASTPTNNEHGNYFGGLGYTINTSNSTLTTSTWNHYAGLDKNGALVTWYGYSDAATQIGRFSTVTSSNGGGTSAMASVYLSTGNAGALASLIIRLVENDAIKYADQFEKAGVSELVKILSDESYARDYISQYSDDFVKYKTQLSSETVPYLAGVHYLTAQLDSTKLADLYDLVCGETGNKIGYIEVDGSMIPLYANDGTYASTMAYFDDYALDSDGSPSSLYNVTATTRLYYQYGYYAQLYYTYQDAMYQTFLWNALMGVTPSDFGLNSSLDLLSKLANSDGTVKAQPGYGLDNFKIAYWHVMYRANENAEWKDMDAYEAIAEQNANGGYINYLSSVIMYEYDHSKTVKSGQITTGTGDSAKPVSDVKVVVYEMINYDTKSSISYIPRCITYTDSEGKFNITVPGYDPEVPLEKQKYLVKYFVGSETFRDGVCVNTIETDSSEIVDYNFVLKPVTQTGQIVDSNNNLYVTSDVTLSFVGSDGVVNTVTVTDGKFTVENLIPGKYTINVYGKDGSLLNTVSSVSIIDGLDYLSVSLGAAKATITVNDMYGKQMDDPVQVTFAGSNGFTFDLEITGSEDVYLPVGKYTLYVKNDYVSVQAKTISLDKSTSTASATLSVYAASSKESSAGSIWSALGYSTVAKGTTVYLPKTLDGYLTEYTGTGSAVSGVLKDNSGTALSGTVAFIGTGTTTGVYLFAADTDGKFSGHVPNGTYTIYATNNSQAVYFNKEISGDTSDIEVKMDVAYAASATVNFKTNMVPSTVGLAFIPLTFTVKVGETTYTIPAVTGSDGKYTLYVPKDSIVSYNVAFDPLDKAYGKSGTGIFNFVETESGSGLVFQSKESTSVSSTTTLETFSIDTKYDETKNTVKPLSKDAIDFIKDDELKTKFDGKLVFDAYAGTDYDLLVTIVNGKITQINKYTITDEKIGDEIDYLIPGRYVVTVYKNGYEDDSVLNGQFIDSQTINIYIDTKEISLTAVACFKVTLTKANEKDTVTVVPIEKDEKVGAYVSVEDKSDKCVINYYLQYDGDIDYEYYFKVTDSDGKVVYSKTFESNDTFKDYTFVESKTLKGYVGAEVDGHLLICDESQDIQVQVEVSKGVYSVDLPKGFKVSSMTLEGKATDDTYTYTVYDISKIDAFTVDEDMTFNLSTTTTSELTSDTVTVDDATLNNGDATVVLRVKNTHDYPVTYFVTGSGALTLDKMYSITISGSDTKENTVEVHGYYNQFTIGAGNSDLTLEVTSIDGTSIGKVVVDKDHAEGSGATGDISVAFAGDSDVSDSADGYSYKYAMRFSNNNSVYKTVKITATPKTDADKWYVMLVDSSGLLIKNNGDSFNLNGLGDTTLYVMLIHKSGDSNAGVPSISLSITGDYSKSVDLDPSIAKVDGSEHSASGAGSDNKVKALPNGFWILTVVVILLLLVTIWGGMKRGVFSRKN